MSVSKPRCARGQNCSHVRDFPHIDIPPSVPHEGDLCSRCIRAGYTSKDVTAPRSKPQKLKKRCPSCRRELGDPTQCEGVVEPGYKHDEVLLCVRCISGARSRADLGYQLPTEEDSALPKGFDELFKAGRVLLEKDAPENQVTPTLALANHLCHGARRLAKEKERLVGLWEDEQSWAGEADSFSRRYGGLRPVEVAQGVLILEREPVSIAIAYSLAHGNPVGVVVSVYPHQTKPAEPDEVASRYSKTLSDAGISCDDQRGVNPNVGFDNDRLVLDFSPRTVAERVEEPQPGWRDRASFTHPRLVRRLYAGLREEFAQDLATRERGKPTEAKNLVPACVAFLLREYGIPPRKEIHRLLNKHELWPAGKNCSDSAISQLWQNVNNKSLVGGPLVDAARTLFYEGYEHNE
jgi:hypothetical protein